MRAGMPIYRNDEVIGWVTSGTMVPYYRHEGLGLATKILDTTAKRAIGLAYLASDVLEDDLVEVDIRGKRVQAVIPPLPCGWTRRPSPVPLSTRRMRKQPHRIPATARARQSICSAGRPKTISGVRSAAST